MDAVEREDRKSRKYKRYAAYSIIILCLYVFFLCTNGFISGITGDYKTLLFNWFGKTNKWSGTFGSENLVQNMNELAALSSRLFISLFSVVFGGYLFYKEKVQDTVHLFLRCNRSRFFACIFEELLWRGAME